MKNRQLIDSWSKIEPDHVAKERILGNILRRVHSDETQTRKAEITMKKSYWKIIAPIAACAVCSVMVFTLRPGGNNNSLELSRSSAGITASYVQEAPDYTFPMMKLREMTEEELFYSDQTDIFSGTVKSTRNVAVLMGEQKNYYAIVEIAVDQVFRGPCASGDIATIVLNHPIDMEGMDREDTNVTGSIREGMKGIFMPLQCDESNFVEIDGETFYWSDLADYKFLDGERYAFLETDDGLVFDRQAYKSIENAATLEDVEIYIHTMLGDR